jgi:putative hydrolase of the HAD superfamily
MPTKYIFDIDLTLYSKNDYQESADDTVFYDSFQPKHTLRKLLLSIPDKKYILTNGSVEHANKILHKLNLEDIFEDMVNGYNLQVYKPIPYIYQEAQYEFMLDDNDTVYYFEDSKENLKVPKKLFDWNTILIDPKYNPQHNQPVEPYIDDTFQTIEDAVSYFTTPQPRFL